VSASELLEALSFNVAESVLPAPAAETVAFDLAVLLGFLTLVPGPDDDVIPDGWLTLVSGITQSQIALVSAITQSQIALVSGITQDEIALSSEDDVVATGSYSVYRGTRFVIPWKFTNVNTTGYTFRSRLKRISRGTVTTAGTINNTTPAASGGGEGTIVLTAAETQALAPGDYLLWVDRTDSGNEDALVEATLTIVAFS
jgi:hypothetical protein